MLGLWFSRHILPLLTFGVTIPLWLILAAVLWVHFDKSSAVRTAVNQAVKELVAADEIAAAKARADFERERRRLAEGRLSEARLRITSLETANNQFVASLALSEAEKESLSHDIDDILSNPVSDACIVDDNLLERLRNR